MPFSKRNPNAEQASKIRSLGFKFYFRKHDVAGTIDEGAAFTDLGVTKNFEEATDETTQEFKANLDGVERTYKKTLASRTRTFTFQSGSTGDTDVTALFRGAAVKVGANSNADLKAVADTGKSTVGDGIIVMKGNEGTHLVGYTPNCSIRGTDMPEEEGFKLYGFEVTIMADPNFTPPTALVDFGTDKSPEITWYEVPDSKLNGVLDTLAGTAPA